MSDKHLTASVVVATYNALQSGHDWFEQQVESILSQTVLPDEVIFTDDCSTDGTRVFIRDLIEQNQTSTRLVLIEQEHNVGFMRNYLSGINATSSDIVFLADQDDVWENERVEKTLTRFEEHPQIQAIHNAYDVIDGDGELLQTSDQRYTRRYTEETQKCSFRFFLADCHYAGMALAFQAEPIKKFLARYEDSPLSISTHDWLICYGAMLGDGLFVSNEVLTHRRDTGHNLALAIGEDGRTASTRLKGLADYLAAFRFVEAWQKLFPEDYRWDVRPFISSCQGRIHYLEMLSLIGWASNFPRIAYYDNSPRSYVGDLIAIVKGKKRGHQHV